MWTMQRERGRRGTKPKRHMLLCMSQSRAT